MEMIDEGAFAVGGVGPGAVGILGIEDELEIGLGGGEEAGIGEEMGGVEEEGGAIGGGIDHEEATVWGVGGGGGGGGSGLGGVIGEGMFGDRAEDEERGWGEIEEIGGEEGIVGVGGGGDEGGPFGEDAGLGLPIEGVAPGVVGGGASGIEEGLEEELRLGEVGGMGGGFEEIGEGHGEVGIGDGEAHFGEEEASGGGEEGFGEDHGGDGERAEASMFVVEIFGGASDGTGIEVLMILGGGAVEV